MKKLAAFVMAMMVFCTVFAQKEINDANAEVREVKGYHGIKVSSGIELTLTMGSTEAVAVSASNIEYRNRIKTVVENGILKIYFDNEDWKLWRNNRTGRLRAYVSAVKVDLLDMSAGAQVKMEGELKGDKLSIDASSGAVFEGKVAIEGAMEVDQSSGAVIRVEGTAASVKLDGSSGSIFYGYDLVVDNAEVDTSSGSSAELTINKELSAEASSGASVRYKGAGVIRNIRTGSGGAVSKRS